MPAMLSGQEYILYCKMFTDMYKLLPQDKGSKFMKAVTVENGLVGEGAVAANQIGETEVQEVTVKNGDSPQNEVTTDRRWFSPRTFNWGHLFDKYDKIRTLGDPSNLYAVAARNAFGRKTDALFLESFFGPNKKGQYGTTDVSFNANNIVAHGSTGLSVAKLLKLRTLFLTNEIDIEAEPMFISITAKQSEDLLSDIKYIGREYGEPILDNGKMKNYLGFEFILKQGLPVVDSKRRCPVWVKSCVSLGVWDDLMTDFAPRKDKQNKPYLYMEQTLNVTRTDEKGCLAVDCAE